MTFTLAMPLQLAQGDRVIISGVTVRAYNNTFTVQTTVDNLHFTVLPAAAVVGTLPGFNGTVMLPFRPVPGPLNTQFTAAPGIANDATAEQVLAALQAL